MSLAFLLSVCWVVIAESHKIQIKHVSSTGNNSDFASTGGDFDTNFYSNIPFERNDTAENITELSSEIPCSQIFQYSIS